MCVCLYVGALHNVTGELAQMVERSLSMREVPGSMPGFSIAAFCKCYVTVTLGIEQS